MLLPSQLDIITNYKHFCRKFKKLIEEGYFKVSDSSSDRRFLRQLGKYRIPVDKILDTIEFVEDYKIRSTVHLLNRRREISENEIRIRFDKLPVLKYKWCHWEISRYIGRDRMRMVGKAMKAHHLIRRLNKITLRPNEMNQLLENLTLLKIPPSTVGFDQRFIRSYFNGNRESTIQLSIDFVEILEYRKRLASVPNFLAISDEDEIAVSKIIYGDGGDLRNPRFHSNEKLRLIFDALIIYLGVRS